MASPPERIISKAPHLYVLKMDETAEQLEIYGLNLLRLGDRTYTESDRFVSIFMATSSY